MDANYNYKNGSIQWFLQNHQPRLHGTELGWKQRESKENDHFRQTKTTTEASQLVWTGQKSQSLRKSGFSIEFRLDVELSGTEFLRTVNHVNWKSRVRLSQGLTADPLSCLFWGETQLQGSLRTHLSSLPPRKEPATLACRAFWGGHCPCGS